MSLTTGSRLGPYEVTGRLGEGGMGEVWRATDTRLDREVAIKVLPAAFTDEKDRLARFEREAKLLAQLHHPNVASIFGLEDCDGVRALVMELVEGPTLADLLSPAQRGPGRRRARPWTRRVRRTTAPSIADDGLNVNPKTNGEPGDNVSMQVRAADQSEIDQLARLWFDSWHESHAAIVPPALTRLRTLESFRDRLRAALPDIRVVGPTGSPRGFCIVKGTEVYQLFVTAAARGSGAAAALMADAEARLSASGVDTAWLACAIGNARAARFYEKSGWQRAGSMLNLADTSEGAFPLEVWRYEKVLRP